MLGPTPGYIHISSSVVTTCNSLHVSFDAARQSQRLVTAKERHACDMDGWEKERMQWLKLDTTTIWEATFDSGTLAVKQGPPDEIRRGPSKLHN